MTNKYDPCAHVNGVAKPSYIHHRVLGRMRPRGPHRPTKPIVHIKPIDPGIDATCKRDVVLSKAKFYPSIPPYLKLAPALAIAGVSGGPTPPPIVTPPSPTQPVSPVQPVVPPSHPQPIPEPASLFLLLAGVMLLLTMRKMRGAARA